MEAPSGEPVLIKAAGGLVWRPAESGPLLAIICRKRYNDWTLPKGKLNTGENWLEAARREVREETGFDARVDGFAGSIAYLVEGKTKIVRFWHMHVVGKSSGQRDPDVETVEWLTPAEAIALLDHPLERTLVETSVPWRPKGTRLERLWRRLFPSRSARRLAESLTPYREELENLIHRAQEGTKLHKGKSEDMADASIKTSWSVAALRLLERADQALDLDDPELGWRCFKAAVRMELYGLAFADRTAFAARAQAIYLEGKEKLSSWRRTAVTDLLEQCGKFNNEATADEVVYAAQILHEHQDNTYHKLQVVRRQLIMITAVAGLAVIAWLGMAPLLGVASSDAVPLHQRGFVSAVVIFGVMGAAISGILSSGKGPGATRIPEQMLGSWITVARLVVGGVAALAVAAFLSSGLLDLGTLTREMVLASAFAAGFSERIVGHAVEAIQK